MVLPSFYSNLVAALGAATILLFSSPTQATAIDFAVTGPNLDLGEPVYQQVICEHSFGNSFGNPYSSTINPPSTKDFSHVMLTMETTCNGTQFDRLAKIFVNGAEIWRTSTSEPAGGKIYFSYTKDVSLYSSLFKIDNVPITVDLGNIVNEIYTAAFEVKITAKYYNSAPKTAFNSGHDSVIDSLYKSAAPDAIKPLIPSDKSAMSGFSWTVPSQTPSIKVDALPLNTTRAVVDIFASGNAGEEFWYMNFDGSKDPSNTPARIITVNIDGDPVGVVLPFPVIYTGGFAPGLWIPIVGVNAYDVPSYRIDITPYLPKLWNGAVITLGVDNGLGGSCNSEWFVSANLLTWQKSGVIGSGRILSGTANKDSNTFNNPNSEDITNIMSVARDLQTRAILIFSSSDGSVNEKAYFTSSQTLSYTNAKNQYKVSENIYYQVAQISSGYSSLKVSNHGADLSKYIDNADDRSSPAESDLITVTEQSYIYPFAMNYYPSPSDANSYQADINRGYGYDDNYLTIWTKQNGTAFTTPTYNSSISTSNVRSDQYYVQNVVQLDGSTTAFNQYVATSGHQVVQNTYGSTSVQSLSSYGTSDPITLHLSAAARYAENNRNDVEGIVAAIKDIFSNILPPIPGSYSSKRSVVPEESNECQTSKEVYISSKRSPSLISRIAKSLGIRSSILDTASTDSSSDTYDDFSINKRDTPQILTTASKVAEFQSGWKTTIQNNKNDNSTSSLDNTSVCWTCKTQCCADCDCGENDYMFTLQIPGRTVSKRGVKGVYLDVKTEEDYEIFKRQLTATTNTIVAPGRSPFFTHSLNKDDEEEGSKQKREASDDEIVAFGRTPFFSKAGSLSQKRDGSSNDANNLAAIRFESFEKWTDTKLLSKAQFWADGPGLFGQSSICTTCDGGYYGGISYSFAGSEKCAWGTACKGSS